MNKYSCLLLVFLFAFSSFSQQKEKATKIDTVVHTSQIKSLLSGFNLLNTHLYSKNDSIYLNANQINDTLYIYIQNNSKRKIDSLTCHYKNIDSILNHYNQTYISKGYIYNGIRPDSIRVLENKMQLYYSLSLNNKAQIDSIIIDRKDFPNNIKKYVSKHYIKQTLNRDNLNRLTEFIRQATKYSIKQTPKIAFYNTKRILYIQPELTAQNYFDGFLGFNYDTEKNKIKLQGRLLLSTYNLFHYNELMNLKWEGYEDTQNFNMSIDIPYLLGSPVYTTNKLMIKRENTTSISLSNQLSAGIRVKNSLMSLHYLYQQKNEIVNKLFGMGFTYTKKPGFKALFENNIFDNTVSYQNKNTYLLLNRLNYHIKINRKTHFAIGLLSYYSINTNDYLASENFVFRNNIVTKPVRELQNAKISYVWRSGDVFLYTITDYNRIKYIEKTHQKYINTGIGIHFFKKNQNLTFEITKPFIIDKSTDIQDVMINIRQKISF